MGMLKIAQALGADRAAPASYATPVPMGAAYDIAVCIVSVFAPGPGLQRSHRSRLGAQCSRVHASRAAQRVQWNESSTRFTRSVLLARRLIQSPHPILWGSAALEGGKHPTRPSTLKSEPPLPPDPRPDSGPMCS